MTDLIHHLTDLDGWTETKSIGCVDGLVCPHCGMRYSLGVAQGLGLSSSGEGRVESGELNADPSHHSSLSTRPCSKAVLICTECVAGFTVTVTDGPLGKAWVTTGGVS